MNLKKTPLSMLIILQLRLLVGCDYIGKASEVDDLVTQQELQKSEIEVLEKQQQFDKHKIEHFRRQQITIVNSTKALTSVMKAVRDKQNKFVFTRFSPAQTQYFILNNGFVDSVGKILSIDTVENGSVIRISLVSLLSVPISNMGFYAT